LAPDDMQFSIDLNVFSATENSAGDTGISSEPAQHW